MIIAVILVSLVIAAAACICWRAARRRGLDRWLVPYLVRRRKRRPPGPDDEVHVLLCIADHFEPKSESASPDVARTRVHRWVSEYPKRFSRFRDSDGRPPRHTFFYPIEEYEPEYLDMLAELCRSGFGEVEVHLHHDRDTASGLEAKLLVFKEKLSQRHGLLGRHADTGEAVYGFVHGNWALCNSRPDGSWCGVENELDVLRATGCYADFTYPSAPDPAQPRKINSLYYASHHWRAEERKLSGSPPLDQGLDVGTGSPPPDSLLLVQGPLLFARRAGSLLPRIENGCLQKSQPPEIERLAHWLRACIQVAARPDWFFVKLHAHGAEETSQEVLLDDPMVRFHEDLASLARENSHFHFHYVTAREMYNLVKAAEAGWKGSVAEARDYCVKPPPVIALSVEVPQEMKPTARSPAPCAPA